MYKNLLDIDLATTVQPSTICTRTILTRAIQGGKVAMTVNNLLDISVKT